MDYKDLEVWKKNQSCIKHTVKLFDKLPGNKIAKNVFDQIFRSLTSVGANLAEGSGSYEGWDFPRFLNISIRSALESDHWFETLKNLFCEHREEIENIRNENFESLKMLISLSKSIKNKRKKH